MIFDIPVAAETCKRALHPIDIVQRAESGAFVWRDDVGFGVGYADPGFGDWIAPPYRWPAFQSAMTEAQRLRAFMFDGDDDDE